jgi:hypothetical protein
MVMSEKNRHYAAETWRKLSENFKTEVADFLRHYKFSGRGQQNQPVIQFQGALKLLMWLPGEKAKSFRSQAAEILTRYYAGDKTLLKEVWENAQSGAPVNQAARAAIGIAELDEYSEKRQKVVESIREDIELVKLATASGKAYVAQMNETMGVKKEMFDMEISFDERKLSIEEKRLAIEKKKLSIEKKRLLLQREKRAFMEEDSRHELDHKKALKELSSQPPVTSSTLGYDTESDNIPSSSEGEGDEEPEEADVSDGADSRKLLDVVFGRTRYSFVI